MAGNIQRAMRNASRSAINKVLAKAKTATSKAVRETYNIKATDLNQVIRIRRASNNNLQGIISVKSRKTSLIKFAAKPKRIRKRTGVTVKVKRRESRKLVTGGFIAKAAGVDAQQIFIRKGRSRLPIKKLFSLSVSKMVEYEGEQALNQTINTDLPTLHKKELAFYISRELRR